MNFFSFILINPIEIAKIEIKNGTMENMRSGKLFEKIKQIKENKLMNWVDQGTIDRIVAMKFFLLKIKLMGVLYHLNLCVKR